MQKAVPVTQNALYSCFALFVADLYSVDAFCCIHEVCHKKNNCSVQIYVFSQKGGVFSLKNLVIFQTVDSKAIKTYPSVKKI
jgi:hypothetical protein